MNKLLISLVILAFVSTAHAASNLLNWTDNSDNETGFKVERTIVPSAAQCVPTAAGFSQIGTSASNIITFADATITEGTFYCYRVRAYNSAGDSAYSNVAGRLVPFSIPANPSGLGVTAGP